MRRLKVFLALVLGLLAGWSGFSQNNTYDQQVDRIVQQLQQHQAALNESEGYPGARQIQKDLAGHSLSEGVENGYREDDWRWKIEEGQISNFKIARVLQKTKTLYVVAAQMRLSNGYYAYDANVKIKYIYTNKNRWKLDYVISEGMYIVVTHEYDNFIRTEIIDDGWGGTNCLQLMNMSELPLGVGGSILTYDGWRKFSTLLPAGNKMTVGGLFGGGSVKDYRIDFVVRVP